jgi:hypothetical protein
MYRLIAVVLQVEFRGKVIDGQTVYSAGKCKDAVFTEHGL